MLPTNWAWQIDGWIVLAGILCAVSASLLGNFLVLRKLSLLGDAITHAVLPGLAVAFLISGSRNGWPMFLGAVIVGIATAFFTEWIRGVGKVDEGASMGVVFTSMFALGLVFIVQAADQVDLDPNCVLYGSIESTPLDTWRILGFRLPKAILTLSCVTVLNLLFVVVFFKELKLSSFDPALATTTGFNAGLMHYGLMILVAITAVACFESVGSVLVVAMFVVPAAAAYMLTDRLTTMIVLSAVIASLSAIFGHLSAITVPGWFGFGSTITSGMMAVVAGLLFVLCAMFGPRHGFVVRSVRQRLLAWQIISDDVVAYLFRLEEKPNSLTGASRKDVSPSVASTKKSRTAAATISNGLATSHQMLAPLLVGPWVLNWTLFWLVKDGQISSQQDQYFLNEKGRKRANELVRSHRLWEQYLVEHASLEADRIHDKAEKMEHFTDLALRQRLDDATLNPAQDPHGAQIPSESED